MLAPMMVGVAVLFSADRGCCVGDDDDGNPVSVVVQNAPPHTPPYTVDAVYRTENDQAHLVPNARHHRDPKSYHATLQGTIDRTAVMAGPP